MIPRATLTMARMRLSCLANPTILVACCLFFGRSVGFDQITSGQGKNPVTVADAIRMTRLADDYYLGGGPSAGRVAHFSASGKQFTITLEKGNAEQNTNEFSLLLFHTADALRSPK